MKRFLDGSGLLYTFSADRVIAIQNGEKYFCENINELLETCEQTIYKQNSLCIATKDGANLTATTYSTDGVSDGNNEEVNWWFSIGDSMVAITAEYTNNNGVYTMELYYYIQDFYNWVKGSVAQGGLVTDGEMYELYEAGNT